MNYEQFYQDYLENEKLLKDFSVATVKLQKNIAKAMFLGDMKAATASLETLSELTSKLKETIEITLLQLKGFPSTEYFSTGDYAQQMIAYCKEYGVDVIGEYPVYEMFPYKVKLDAETHDIFLDKKKFSCLRPKAFAEMVKKNKDRLDSTSFNTQQFLDELSSAYDLLVMKNKVEAGSGILLTNIYKMLVPMSRFKKDYNAQAFAFDLARLYTHRDLKTSEGRSFSFGSDRKASKLIRILDSNGQEQYLGTIAFILE